MHGFFEYRSRKFLQKQTASHAAGVPLSPAGQVAKRGKKNPKPALSDTTSNFVASSFHATQNAETLDLENLTPSQYLLAHRIQPKIYKIMTLEERTRALRQSAQPQGSGGGPVKSGRRAHAEDTNPQLSFDPTSSYQGSGALSPHGATEKSGAGQAPKSATDAEMDVAGAEHDALLSLTRSGEGPLLDAQAPRAVPLQPRPGPLTR